MKGGLRAIFFCGLLLSAGLVDSARPAGRTTRSTGFLTSKLQAATVRGLAGSPAVTRLSLSAEEGEVLRLGGRSRKSVLFQQTLLEDFSSQEMAEAFLQKGMPNLMVDVFSGKLVPEETYKTANNASVQEAQTETPESSSDSIYSSTMWNALSITMLMSLLLTVLIMLVRTRTRLFLPSIVLPWQQQQRQDSSLCTGCASGCRSCERRRRMASRGSWIATGTKRKMIVEGRVLVSPSSFHEWL
uniref:Uncharacterized protein n=1 Tax=Chromera velia CCMP2878 TaxID=1169474 RepID=A0A0G4FWC4_9ALVE|mmetsp:Transcript_20300/g.40647  ORF Transcript_20300/g.40647 Transcript_20300/m.40647 type:complete len:243 (+) Transcript_20300:297-1025(+)|eukprot:Cvel_19102.t1-p1 / transcript=Cvel_19102.t1 / gene=Cvel_19102 / organism=Chromera_velia_CCMP2878 / gene_product=hypothetical protein / transcript_product=hypothetical protein / location=Cvel_scaffold1621:33080-34671(+) / protein_length=242 / sequence_SO=supercontig / SO=protein_coding / is_pseudo=false